ncbi:MAG: hypothetical protein K6A44_00545 [bacterium]|nr:hypothetical protein [bacterium]
MNKKENLVLILGNNRGDIANYIQERVTKGNILCVDNDVEKIKSSNGNTLLYTGQNSIVPAIENASKITVIAPCGEQFWIDKMLDVLEVLSANNADYRFIVTLPFTFEGKNKFLNAHIAADTIKKMVKDCTILNNNNILENVTQKIRMEDAYKVINQIVCNFVNEV